MKRQLLVAALAVALSLNMMAQVSNPLLNEFDTPFQIAPFEKITIDNYREAILKGLDEDKKEIEAIIKNPAAPNFENTIAALDQSGKLLDKAESTFSQFPAVTQQRQHVLFRKSSLLYFLLTVTISILTPSYLQR